MQDENIARPDDSDDSLNIEETIESLDLTQPSGSVGSEPELGSDEDADPEGATVAPSPAGGAASSGSTSPSRVHGGEARPTQIGRYEIIGVLGRGGMGTVYHALDANLSRRVALKVLPSRLSDNPSALEAFREEARLLASLSHPNIATVYSLEQDGETFFLTMELVAGQTLADRVRRGPLPFGEWLISARQIGAALEAAHGQGIVHLDLKPANVMVTDEGQVKVLDFGLAMTAGTRFESGGAQTQSFKVDSIAGTPGYMAPEQIQLRLVDSRADIWALGCVLYECATGQRAFEGGDLREKLRHSLTHEPDMSILSDEYPASVVPMLRASLVKNAARRTATIDELLGSLEDIVHDRVDAPKDTPNNLPSQLSTFVGRERQKKELLGQIDETRLLTVSGFGGAGKTRLALEVAQALLERFHHGVWYVDLTNLTEPSQVATRFLRVLGLKEESGREVMAVLVEHLSEKNVLLLLDDCETQMDGAVSLIEELLRSCPNLTVLATSREALNAPGEVIYSLGSMSMPQGEEIPALGDVRDFEAVQLFEARAKAVQPKFEIDEQNAGSVLQICQQLDGIPLAIELAAARVRVLPPAGIAERLDDRFRLLTSNKRGGVSRHQTLRALIDWSYQQLEPGEQATLDRLAIFAGGWELEACERICVGDDVEEWELLDHLTNLVDKSLVEVDLAAGERTGRTRYKLLQTIRAFAAERLSERADRPEVAARHRHFFLDLAKEGVAELSGSEQDDWVQRLAADHHNFRAALEAETEAEAHEERIELAGTLGRYWANRGHWTEGRTTLERLLGDDPPRTSTVALGHNWAGNFARLQGDMPEARAHLEASLSIRREVEGPEGVAQSLHNLGHVLRDCGDRAAARTHYEESRDLFESLGDDTGLGHAFASLGILSVYEQDLEGAEENFERCLDLREKVGDRHEMASCLNNLGWVAEAKGDLAGAADRQRRALKIHRESGQKFGVAASLTNLANIAKRMDNAAESAQLYQEALAITRELGNRQAAATILQNLADLEILRDDLEAAKRYCHEGLTLLDGIGDEATIPHFLRDLARLAAREDQNERAVVLLSAADRMIEGAGNAWSAETKESNQTWFAELSEALGAEAAEAAWDRGRALPREDAIREALL